MSCVRVASLLAVVTLGCSSRSIPGVTTRDLSSSPSSDLAMPPLVQLPDGGSCHPAGSRVPEEWTSWFCCDHAEVGGVCCQSSGGACGASTPCCSGSCAGGTCACSPAGAVCGTDGDCCGGDACSYTHNSGPNATCCGRPGKACTADGDCCGGCVNGTCGALGVGQPCRGDADCVTRRCGSDGGCAQSDLGGRCVSSGDCAWGGCKNGTCTCTPVGGGYDVDAPCCSGYFLAPSCQCAAGASPGSCVTSADCCGGPCARSGSSVGMCTCHGPTAICNVGGECCSGRCVSGACQ